MSLINQTNENDYSIWSESEEPNDNIDDSYLCNTDFSTLTIVLKINENVKALVQGVIFEILKPLWKNNNNQLFSSCNTESSCLFFHGLKISIHLVRSQTINIHLFGLSTHLHFMTDNSFDNG